MAIKGIPIAPLSGLLDVRTQPDLMSPGSLRMRQNLTTIDSNTIRRGRGWQKLFSQSSYNNPDFHDQLLTFGGAAREPITMLDEVEASNKARWLFLATQSRIAKLNEYTGNWTILGTGFGGGTGKDLTGPRFQCSVLGDYVTFTNGVDMPMFYVMDSLFTADQLYTGSFVNPNGNITPANQADSAQYFQQGVTPVVLWNWDEINLVWVLATSLLQTFDDLALIGLTTARKTWMWRNCTFLADVTMDGTRLSYRFVWSDYNNPTSFDPSINGSITGFQDLDFGETILGGKPSGNSFLIYTNKGIWELYVLDTANTASTSSTTTSVFGVRRLPGIVSDVCLKYENTLVDCGDGHIYMAKDRICFFNQWMSEPDIMDWVNAASYAAYQSIVSSVCQAHVAAYHQKEVYISVLTSNSTNGCPDITLRINMDYHTVDIIDAGFTALAEFRPQNFPTIRDWIIDQQICTPTALNSAGYGWTNEGLPNPLPTPTAPFAPTVFYTHSTQTVDGVLTEDWTQPQAPDSLCALLAQEGFGSLLSYCENCDASPILVSAYSIDWCLKDMGQVFYRERCTNPTTVGSTGGLGYTSSAGTYVLDPYTSLIRFAPIFAPNALMKIQKILLNYLTVFILMLFLASNAAGRGFYNSSDWIGQNFLPLSGQSQFVAFLESLGFGNITNASFASTPTITYIYSNGTNLFSVPPLTFDNYGASAKIGNTTAALMTNAANSFSGSLSGNFEGYVNGAITVINGTANGSGYFIGSTLTLEDSLGYDSATIGESAGGAYLSGSSGNFLGWSPLFGGPIVTSSSFFHMGASDLVGNGGSNTTSIIFLSPSTFAYAGPGGSYDFSVGTNVQASAIVGVISTNNLPLATTSTPGGVIPDGTTIVIGPTGVISSTATGTNGGSGATNVFFMASGTIGWTVVGGTNEFYLITGSVTSNYISGKINIGQIFGALTNVTASPPLLSSLGTTPNLSLTGAVAFTNLPLTIVTNVTPTNAGPNILSNKQNPIINTNPPTLGTVTSVTGTSPLTSSGGATPAISISSSTGSGAVVLGTSPTITTPNIVNINFSGTVTEAITNQNLIFYVLSDGSSEITNTATGAYFLMDTNMNIYRSGIETAASFVGNGTNTLTVTSSGITNSTVDNYLLTITAGTALALKDGNGNAISTPVLNETIPLKPNWRFTGTAVTAQAYQFP